MVCLCGMGWLPARALAQNCGQTVDPGTERAGGVVGLVQGLTSAVGGPRCPDEATSPAAPDVDEAELTGALPEQLQRELALRPARPEHRDLGDRIVNTFFGGTDARHGWWAESLANALSIGVFGAQVIFDATLPFRRDRDDDAWWRVLLVDAMAHALAQSMTAVLGELTERHHEGQASALDEDDDGDALLAPGARATLTFTSASLMCLHGSMNGDSPAACLTGVAAASVAGVMWGLDDEQRWSDVLTSAGIGILAGYVIPWMTFYGFGQSNPLAPSAVEDDDGIEVWVSPSFSTRGAGLRLQGTF